MQYVRQLLETTAGKVIAGVLTGIFLMALLPMFSNLFWLNEHRSEIQAIIVNAPLTQRDISDLKNALDKVASELREDREQRIKDSYRRR